MKFNKITFLGRYDQPGPAEQFATLMLTLSSSIRAGIKDVTLQNLAWDRDYNTLVEPAAFLLPVADFCRTHPNANVRYIPGYFGVEESMAKTFIMMGVYLNMAFRGKSLVSDITRFEWTDVHSMKHTAWVTDSASAAAINVPNLRFWPTGKGFKESMFRWELGTSVLLREEPCINLARDWVNNGI